MTVCRRGWYRSCRCELLYRQFELLQNPKAPFCHRSNNIGAGGACRHLQASVFTYRFCRSCAQAVRGHMSRSDEQFCMCGAVGLVRQPMH